MKYYLWIFLNVYFRFSKSNQGRMAVGTSTIPYFHLFPSPVKLNQFPGWMRSKGVWTWTRIFELYFPSFYRGIGSTSYSKLNSEQLLAIFFSI